MGSKASTSPGAVSVRLCDDVMIVMVPAGRSGRAMRTRRVLKSQRKLSRGGRPTSPKRASLDPAARTKVQAPVVSGLPR